MSIKTTHLRQKTILNFLIGFILLLCCSLYGFSTWHQTYLKTEQQIVETKINEAYRDLQKDDFLDEFGQKSQDWFLQKEWFPFINAVRLKLLQIVLSELNVSQESAEEFLNKQFFSFDTISDKNIYFDEFRIIYAMKALATSEFTEISTLKKFSTFMTDELLTNPKKYGLFIDGVKIESSAELRKII